MKITRYKADPKQPYSLHDFRINGMDFIEGDLNLSFENGFMNLDGQDHPDLQGNIVIEQVDPDFCEVVIQGKGGKKGGFRGEKLTITEFTEKYKSYSFEVIDEYYGWHRLHLAGWLWMPGTYPKDMTLSIGYFKGDVVYNTDEE